MKSQEMSSELMKAYSRSLLARGGDIHRSIAMAALAGVMVLRMWKEENN